MAQDITIKMTIIDNVTGELREITANLERSALQIREMTDEEAKAFREANKELEEKKKKAKDAEEQENRLGKAISSLTKLTSLFGAVTSSAMVLAMKSVQGLGAQMWTLSQQMGVSVETLSSWKLAAEKSGASLSNVAMAIRILSMRISALQAGSKETTRLFESIGISVRDQQGHLKTMDDLLLDLADHFSKLPDGTQKSAEGMRVFGRAWMGIAPLMNQGRKGLQEFRAEAERLGLIWTREQAQLMDTLQASMLGMKNAVIGLAKAFAIEMAPVMIDYYQKITNIIAKMREWIQGHRELTQAIGLGIGKLVIMVTVLATVTTSVVKLIEVFSRLGQVMALGGVGGAVAQFGLLGAAVGSFFIALNQLDKYLEERENKKLYGKPLEGIASSTQKALLSLKQAGELTGKLTDLFDKQGKVAEVSNARIAKSYQSSIILMKYGWEVSDTTYGKLTKKQQLAIALSGDMKKAFEESGLSMDELTKKYGEGQDALSKFLVDVAKGKDEKLLPFARVLEKHLPEAFAEFKKAVLADPILALQQLGDALDEGKELMEQLRSEFRSKLGIQDLSFAAKQWTAFTEVMEEAQKEGADTSKIIFFAAENMKSYAESIRRTAQIYGLELTPEQKKFISAIEAVLKANERAKKSFEDLGSMMKTVSEMPHRYEEAFKDLQKTLEKQGREMAKDIGGFLDTIEAKLRELYTIKPSEKEIAKMKPEERLKYLEEEAAARAIEEWKKVESEILDRLQAIKDAYIERRRAVVEQWNAERERFEWLIQSKKMEAEIEEALARHRQRLARATSIAEVEAARQAYEKEIALLEEKGRAIIESEKQRALEAVDTWKRDRLDPIEAMLKGYLIRLLNAEKDAADKARKEARDSVKGITDDTTASLAGVMGAVAIFFQGIASQAKGTVGQVAAAFSRLAASIVSALQQGAKSAKDIIQKIGIEVSMALGQAIGEAIAGTGKRGTYAGLGSGVGAMAGGIIGALLGSPQLGAQIGGFLGGIVGSFFKKARTEEEKEAARIATGIKIVQDSLRSLGEISEQTARQYLELRKTMNAQTAEAVMLAQWMNETGITTKNFAEYGSKLNSILIHMKQGFVEVEKGTAAAGKAFSEFIKFFIEKGAEGHKILIEFIQRAREFGYSIREVDEYVYGWLQRGTEGLTKFLQGINPIGKSAAELAAAHDELVKKMEELRAEGEGLAEGTRQWERWKEEINEVAVALAIIEKAQADYNQNLERNRHALERATSMAVAMFNALIAQGKSWTEAMMMMREPISLLKRKYEELGLTATGAVVELFGMADLIEKNKELFEAISGVDQALQALGNTGFLTLETFTDIAAQTRDFYNRLIEGGATSKQALAAIAPTLANLTWYAEQYGFELDESTQSLIEQAKEAGVYKERAKSLTEVLQEGFKGITEKLDEIADIFRSKIPRAMEEGFGQFEAIVGDAVGRAADMITDLPAVWDDLEFPEKKLVVKYSYQSENEVPVTGAQYGFEGVVTGPRLFYIEPGKTEAVSIKPISELQSSARESGNQNISINIEPVVIPRADKYIIDFVVKKIERGRVRIPITSVRGM